MKHNIPIERLGPNGVEMALAVEKCVHCGFCLPTCPTYNLLGEEMDSPRGRIILMKSILEGHLELDQAMPFIDRCLGCQACVTACPSGVEYGNLIVPFRSYADNHRHMKVIERFMRWLILETLPYKGRFRWASRAGMFLKPVNGRLPGDIHAMISLLPDELPSMDLLPGFYPCKGKRRARVALLVGCVQQVLAPEINWATLRVLARNGVEVVIPEDQGCCGALALHMGVNSKARRLARRNLSAFPKDVDAVITTAAGCGSGMHDYPLLFKGNEFEEEATEFAEKVQDVSVFLDQLGLIEPGSLTSPETIAYHDACHLSHAQKVTIEPRRLLGNVENLTLVPIAEAELCCGSAGIYNIEQPEIASQLGERKARNILNSGAMSAVSGNIGCIVQLRSSLERMGSDLPVWHTIEILDRAYQALD
jgi:glycolate oxidase iron-sulfur subunit